MSSTFFVNVILWSAQEGEQRRHPGTLVQRALSARKLRSKKLDRETTCEILEATMHFRVSRSLRSVARNYFLALFVTTILATTSPLRGATGGSISGTVVDPSGAVVRSALKLVNTAQQTTYRPYPTGRASIPFPIFPSAITISPLPPPDLHRNGRPT